MKPEKLIVLYLRSVRCLLNGRLWWDGELAEVPMQFYLGHSGLSFRALPVIKSSLTAGVYRHMMDILQNTEKETETPAMLIVPSLSAAMIEKLDSENERILAVDVRGNGIIKLGTIYVCVSCHAGRNTEPSRAVRAFKGLSSQVAMVLLESRQWPKHEDILQRIQERGGQLSQPQLSKTIHAYQEMDIIRYQRGQGVFVLHPSYLLEHLLHEWDTPKVIRATYMRLRSGITWEQVMLDARKQGINWCYSPEASLHRYAVYEESGAGEIWTASPDFFETYMEEAMSPAFARYKLCLIPDSLAYFQNCVDASGERWSGPVAACIEATRGDARQRATADEVYQRLVKYDYKALINRSI